MIPSTVSRHKARKHTHFRSSTEPNDIVTKQWRRKSSSTRVAAGGDGEGQGGEQDVGRAIHNDLTEIKHMLKELLTRGGAAPIGVASVSGSGHITPSPKIAAQADTARALSARANAAVVPELGTGMIPELVEQGTAVVVVSQLDGITGGMVSKVMGGQDKAHDRAMKVRRDIPEGFFSCGPETLWIFSPYPYPGQPA
jgi:hypothetical protein